MQFLQAKNNKASLEGRMATLKEQISMTRITSPISGTVEVVNIKKGELASPGVPVFRIVNLSEYEIKAKVAENYSLSVSEGTPVKLYFPDLKAEIESNVSYVGKVIDPVNRTFDVIVRLKSPTANIKPNMVAVMKIMDFHKEDAVVIPLNVIQTANNKKYVFIANTKNGTQTAERREVISSHHYGGNALIESGLNPSDTLISFGFQDLTEGQIIKF